MLVVGGQADAANVIEKVLSDEDNPEDEQGTVEDALPNVAHEGHEFNVKEKTQILDGNIELSDAQAKHGERLLEKIRVSPQLTQSAAVPEKGGHGNASKEELQCKPYLREATVLVNCHHAQITQETKVFRFFCKQPIVLEGM